jgi:hypothetical protein
MYQDQIFLDETGCVLNEKMMPDATIMVPDLEIGKKVSNIDVFGKKCGGTPVLHNRYDGYKNDTAMYLSTRVQHVTFDCPWIASPNWHSAGYKEDSFLIPLMSNSMHLT